LLVIAAQKIGDRPDEGRKIGIAHARRWSGDKGEKARWSMENRRVIILC
jgi:hypothetical protein